MKCNNTKNRSIHLRATLLCAIILFSLNRIMAVEAFSDPIFYYTIGARGGYIGDFYSQEYTYNDFGFQIFRTFYLPDSVLVTRSSDTWNYELMWCPFAHSGNYNDLLVYKDPPSGPPFSGDYGAFPPDNYYYGKIPSGGSISLPGGHYYYMTTQGFSTLYPHQPIYPPQIRISYGVSTYRTKSGSTSYVGFFPTLIDQMDLSGMGLVTYYNLTIITDTTTYFDYGDLLTNPVEITTHNGRYSFWLKLDAQTVKLFGIFRYYAIIDVGGYIIPVDKFSLLAPYITLASILAVAVTTTIYAKRVRLGKKKI